MQSFDIQPYLWAREREGAGCNIVLLGPSLISTPWSDCGGTKSPSVCQLMSLLLIDTRGPPSAASPIPTLLPASLSTGGTGTHASDQGGDASIWSLLGEEVYTQVIKVAAPLILGEVVYTQVIKVATPLHLGEVVYTQVIKVATQVPWSLSLCWGWVGGGGRCIHT